MSAWSRFAAVALGLGMLMGLAAGRAAADPILYTQPSTFQLGQAPSTPTGVGIYFSQNDTEFAPPNLYQAAYDNFTLSASASITSVQWQGGYNGPATQGTITAFHLTIWPDMVVGGVHQPNTSVSNPFSLTIPGNANETLAGPEIGSSGTTNLIFNYSANLPQAFTAQAGTEYWLSIFPDLNSSAAGNWGWHTGMNGDGFSVVDTFDPSIPPGAGRFVNPNDLTFTLLGPAATVPEPSTLALLGLGCAGLVGRYCSRKKRLGV
jgi:PEP-CTERM motif